MSSSHHCLIHGLLAIMFVVVSSAAPFVAPAEENPPFRRDLLPIDTDSMVTLSEDLTLLSQGLSLKIAEERRAAAQTLSLALALDPANSSARDNLSAIADGKKLSAARPARVTRAKARVWQIHAWLNTPEAGVDGKLLADMLGDAARVLDPENPVAEVLAESPELGKWDELVAPLSAFESKRVAKNTPDKKGVDPFEDVAPDMPVKPAPADGQLAITLKEGALGSVFRTKNLDTKEWEFEPVPLIMNASAEDTGETEAFQITVAGNLEDQERIDRFVGKSIRDALEKFHGGLPAKGGVSIFAGEDRSYSLSQNLDSITGPGFVLASAAISGRETDGTVISRFDGDGGITTPEFFWCMVSELIKGEGGRLVVPKGAEEYLLAILALEKPEFFLKYEVVVASDLNDLVEFSAKKPSEKNAGIYAKFAEIKAKSEGNPVGTYLANRFVRQKLQEIVDEAPYHLSARALALQGAGERPRVLSQKVLAAEIWRVVEPIAAVSKLDAKMAEPESIAALEELYDQTRAELDRLDRYTEIRDRELLAEGKNLTTTVRTLARALRSRNDDLIKRFEAIKEAHTALVKTNTDIMEKLSKISGDPMPDEAGNRRNRRLRNNAGPNQN